MPAKHTAKKTVRKKSASRKRVKPVEKVVSQQPAIIQNDAFQAVALEPVQLVQPIIPVQPTQPIQPVQPVVPMQTAAMASSSQPMPFQGTSSFEKSTTIQPPQPAGASADASIDPEPEIKMGTDAKPISASSADGKIADPKTDPPQTAGSEENSQGKKNLFLPILIIVLLGVGVLTGLFIYRENFTKKAEKINEVSLSSAPAQKPTPKQLDLTKFEISVLNGSGVEGAAGSQKSDLESIGFKISSVGNADESNHKETIIQAKKIVDKAFLDKLKTVLEKSFTFGEVEELDEEETADVVIIIGTKKEE